MPGCLAVPHRAVLIDPGSPTRLPAWEVNLDHVRMQAPPKQWDPDAYIVFRVTKTPKEHLMTPEAHFYGHTAYGYIVWRTKPDGPVRWMRVRDFPPSNDKHWKRVTLSLCSLTGAELPEVSNELYPSRKTVHCSVSMSTFHAATPGDVLHLAPDPDRVDVNQTPTERWVYSAGHSWGAENGLTLRVSGKERNFQLPSGRCAAFVINGNQLHQKIVQTPLHREAGTHTYPGPDLREKAQPGVSRQRLHVYTSRKVVAGAHFRVKGHALQVTDRAKGGFYACHLLNDKKGGSLRDDAPPAQDSPHEQ